MAALMTILSIIGSLLGLIVIFILLAKINPDRQDGKKNYKTQMW